VSDITILRDDREKYPWNDSFFGQGFKTEQKRLKTGDYTIKGMEKIFVVEKKRNWGELNIDFSKKYIKGTDKALKRLTKYPIHLMVLTDNVRSMRNVYSPSGTVPYSRILYIYTQLLYVYKVNLQIVGKDNKRLIIELFRNIHKLKKDGLV